MQGDLEYQQSASESSGPDRLTFEDLTTTKPGTFYFLAVKLQLVLGHQGLPYPLISVP